MANALFGPAAQGLLTGEIDLDTAAIKAAFVRGYTFVATHKFVSDVTGAGGVLNGTSAALTGLNVSTAGVVDADDTTATTVASAANHSVLLFQASAVTGGADVAAGAQRLIAYLDSGTSLPIQPGSGATAINFDNGANKIFKVG